MVIKFNFNSATIRQPGAYSQTSVNVLGGFPLSDTGIVGIVGEALTGEPGDSAGVQTFTSEQMASLVQTYTSGPIVDVARALIQPARDARIVNGAQMVRVWKTNSSTQAAAEIDNINTVADKLYDVKSRVFGSADNLINFYITEGSTSDDLGSVLSDAAVTFPVTITSGDTLVVVINGVTYTLTVTTAPGGSMSLSQAQCVTLINGTAVTIGADTATPVWAPSRPVVASADGTTKIKLTINDDVITAYSSLHEYAMMTLTASNIATTLKFTVASTVNATTLEVTAGGAGPVRGSRGTRVVVVNRNDFTEILDENSGDELFKIRYLGAGTPATMSVVLDSGKKRLQTVCTGATGDNLDLDLSQYTIRQLVDFINNIDGGATYKCVTSYFNASVRPATDIDWYRIVDIKTLPLSVRGDYLEIEENVNDQSQLVTLTAQDSVYGQLETILSTDKRYLTGGALGASTNQDFLDGLDALLAYRCNTIVPCISRDASEDVTDGLTDPLSTYDIDSVIAAVDTHCRTASNTKNRSERNCFLGFKDTFANSVVAARDLNSEFATMAFQDVDFLDTDGTIKTKQPHVLAALAAGAHSGMQVGEDLTFKYLNCYGLSHEDFDPSQDVDTAVDAGLFVVKSPDSGGYRVVVGNTTYGKDANFVFNRIGVMAVAHYVAYNLRNQLEAVFVGTGRQSASTSRTAIYNMTESILNSFRDAGLLVPDVNNGYVGYKDLTVTMDGSAAYIDVKITPLQAIGFIFIRLSLDNIRDE